jgi:hypothetical protein
MGNSAHQTIAASLLLAMEGHEQLDVVKVERISPLTGEVLGWLCSEYATTRLCFDRSIELSLIPKSVFLLISMIATSSALWRKLAQIGKGGS